MIARVVLLLLLCTRLASAQAPSLDELLRQSIQPGSTPERSAAKEQAQTALFQQRGVALRFLVERVDWEQVMIPVYAQQLVDQLPASEAIPALSPLLDHPSTNVVRLALFYLGFFPAPELAPRVVPLLANERLAGAGIRALGKWQVTNEIPAIARGLSSTNERVRVAAANALRDVRDPRALDALIPALADPVFTVRRTAIRALVSYGEEGEQRLMQLLAGEQRALRRNAIVGLRDCATASARAVLKRYRQDADPVIREDIDRALTAGVSR